MCHLSIEKALKGIYTYKLQQIPSKTYNLLYLIEKIGLNVSEKLYNFIFSLNRVSIPTRYPDNLQRMLKEYNKERVEDILKKTLEALKWLKIELQKQLSF
ncbi:HEPN domain-containing protein [Candidatus Aerophobetes bacterium]|nr:HEPN domain-containing protein [Candidatus Aerophobetes bacterium]